MDVLAVIVLAFLALCFLYSVVRLGVRDGIRDARRDEAKKPDS